MGHFNRHLLTGWFSKHTEQSQESIDKSSSKEKSTRSKEIEERRTPRIEKRERKASTFAEELEVERKRAVQAKLGNSFSNKELQEFLGEYEDRIVFAVAHKAMIDNELARRTQESGGTNDPEGLRQEIIRDLYKEIVGTGGEINS